VRRVVRTGIDVNHVNDLGWTALLEAVILGDGGERHQQIVGILLDAGADRSIADRDGVTAFEHARHKGQPPSPGSSRNAEAPASRTGTRAGHG
jgi:ankyrin repeat protein